MNFTQTNYKAAIKYNAVTVTTGSQRLPFVAAVDMSHVMFVHYCPLL